MKNVKTKVHLSRSVLDVLHQEIVVLFVLSSTTVNVKFYENQVSVTSVCAFFFAVFLLSEKICAMNDCLCSRANDCRQVVSAFLCNAGWLLSCSSVQLSALHTGKIKTFFCTVVA